MIRYGIPDYFNHECTVLLWPYGDEYWRCHAKPIQSFYLEYMIAIASFEPVQIGVTPDEFQKVSSLIESFKTPFEINVFPLSYDDVFLRDTSPTLIFDCGQLRGVEWDFNGWGGVKKGLCTSWALDNLVSEQLTSRYGIASVKSSLVFEGGGILFDGLDSAVLVKRTLLNANRNPNLTQRDATEMLMSLLPVQHVIWINQGLNHDETDGHIDNLLAFKSPTEILLAWTDDPLSTQYDIVREAFNIITNHYASINRDLTIHKIAIPEVPNRTIEECAGITIEDVTYTRHVEERLLGSYLNFIYVNDGIILPAFGVPLDQTVCSQFETIFPNRKIVLLNSRELILGGGSFHCSSFHIPKLKENSHV